MDQTMLAYKKGLEDALFSKPKVCFDDVYYLSQPFRLEYANTKHECAQEMHVIEEINWTIWEENQEFVTLNRYFALTFADAVGLGAFLELRNREVATNIVNIRPATPQEIEEFWATFDEREQAREKHDETKA